MFVKECNVIYYLLSMYMKSYGLNIVKVLLVYSYYLWLSLNLNNFFFFLNVI